MSGVRCIACGYDLSGQTGAYRPGVRCPECGEADAARPAPKDVGGAAWRAALGVVLLVGAVYAVAAFPMTSGPIVVMSVMTGGSCASLVSAVRRSRGWGALVPAALLAAAGLWTLFWLGAGLLRWI